MNSLLQYRDHNYFEERKDDHFIFSTVNPIVKITKLISYKGMYYFDLLGYQIKAITTPSISYSEVIGLKVIDKKSGSEGAIANKLVPSSLGIHWTKYPSLKQPWPYFWNNINHLIL